MLRSRDIVAVLVAAWLVRMAWKDDQDFLSASIHLAFYTYGNGNAVAPMDVDGDGTNEGLALAVATHNKTQWQMEILDLKKLHHHGNGVGSPFRPPAMVSSSSIVTVANPIKVVTGQLIPALKEKEKPVVKLTPIDESVFNERTRHYFCGVDWKDASDNCRQPCPKGTATECPDGEKCYADTACNALDKIQQPAKAESDLILTPAGGLPSIVSLWSDGKVRMHSLTADKGATSLELRLMWTQDVALEVFSEHDLLLANDIVIVGGTSSPNAIVVAFNALTGDVLWNTKDNAVIKAQDERKRRGSTSFARRRSRIISQTESAADSSLPSCWAAFRHSLLESGLPHSYWGPRDATWTAVHLNKTPKPKKMNQKHKKWHQRHHRRGPIHGKPNALLSHSQQGILVRSLKNGRPLCHLSLLDHVLYGDLNHDGTLDQLQVVTDDSDRGDGGDEWVARLAQQVANQDIDRNATKRLVSSNRLCHVLALSGLPAREELFSANLCGPGFSRDFGDHESIPLIPAPPIVVGEKEVMIALSNGMVSKHNTVTGKPLWNMHGQNILEDFPTWGRRSTVAHTAQIGVMKAPNAPPPILLAGESSMVLLSAATGRIMASGHFPQISQTRPILADLTGDGTTDIIIATNDALWGYQVIVQSGASVLFRILTGLLLMGMALALLRNRFGQRSDKRSTDE